MLRPTFGLARALHSTLFVLLTAAPGYAQRIPVLDPTSRDLPQPGTAEALAREAGLRALAAGDAALAREHLLRVLWRHPACPELHADLLRTCVADEEGRTLWSHAWFAVASDPKGKARVDRELKGLLAADDPHPAAIAAARAEALRVLLAWAAKLRSGPGARGAAAQAQALWAREVGRVLVEDAPPLAESAGRLDEVVERFAPAWDEVLAALRSELQRSVSARDLGVGIRAARILRGFVAQAAFQDLEGPAPPALGELGKEVARALESLRRELSERSGEPWTVDALGAMEPAEKDAFSEAHRDFDAPGVAVSPTGLYRLETSCGHGTLLGAADTVELHHRRLVNWYGQDPFQGRPGLVRIVPESFGLEEEGAPFWWAGGFQSGDVTTVKFTCGTVEGLGRALTHELTHRFDGALHPGLPAWMVEGRAVWTAAAYGSSADEEFAAGHASFGPIEQAFVKGYGGERKLEQLIRGEIADYRDNYTAGYALWVYLSSWQPGGQKPYQGRLDAYMSGIRKGWSDPLGWFATNFCDGEEGRAKDFASFAKAFGEFVGGFYWQNRAPWTERYHIELGRGAAAPYVYEDEAWSWERDRAEPWFGQDQAGFAGDLLVELGKRDAACAAYAASLAVDEWSEKRVRALAGLLRAEGQGLGASCLEQLCFARRAGASAPADLPLPSALAAVTAYGEALHVAASNYAERGWPNAAYALEARRERLQRILGEPVAQPTPPPEQGSCAHPIDRPAVRLGAQGWIETGLTGYEERRVRDLWYETPDADLFVGRAAPREGTGVLDRASHQRHAFVRSQEWVHAGSYLFTAKVHFTTSFNSGAIVLGYTRRDRNLRLSFSAGDFLYAIGQKEEAAELESVRVSLGGLRVRDAHLGGALANKNVKFGRPSSWFSVELLVDGPVVHAWVDDSYLGSYHTVDGQPIEGAIGFAMGQGAVRIEAPTVQRMDLSLGRFWERKWPGGLRLDRAEAIASSTELRNRPILGVPTDPRGTIALYLQDRDGEKVDDERRIVLARRAVERLQDALAPWALPQRRVLLVPAGLQAAGRARLEALLAETAPGMEIVEHRVRESIRLSPEDDGAGDDRPPWLFFVDPSGVLRVIVPYSGRVTRLPDSVRHWALAYRARPVEGR